MPSGGLESESEMKIKAIAGRVASVIAICAATLAIAGVSTEFGSGVAGAAGSCSSGYTCFWTLTFAGGAEGNIQSTNEIWGQLPYYGGCTSGTWNDCAESIQDLEAGVNYLWQNNYCSGGYFSINPGVYDTTLGVHANWISSNRYNAAGAGC